MKSQRKVILYIATSLDGYIARENGSLDWLFAIDGDGDNGFSEFYQTIDTIIMGRATFDHLMTLVEEYPHSDKETYIFSRQEKAQAENIKFVNEDVSHFTQKLKQQDGTDIWLVGGANLLDEFIIKNLVDEMIITIAPLILGNGIPLFKKNNLELNLSLKESKHYGQFIQNHYIMM
jgi:dihydrofolate reductase